MNDRPPGQRNIYLCGIPTILGIPLNFAPSDGPEFHTCIANLLQYSLDFKFLCTNLPIPFTDSNYNHIVMSTEFESLDQPLMVEIIRRRQMKETAPATSDHRQPGQGDSKSSSLKNDLRRFLQATGAEFSDIKLVLESNTFPAHKAILAARSSYFEGTYGFDNYVWAAPAS